VLSSQRLQDVHALYQKVASASLLLVLQLVSQLRLLQGVSHSQPISIEGHAYPLWFTAWIDPIWQGCKPQTHLHHHPIDLHTYQST
jgi:hypothetical protein